MKTLGYLLFAGFITLILFAQVVLSRDCSARGGVYLFREGVCIKAERLP